MDWTRPPSDPREFIEQILQRYDRAKSLRIFHAAVIESPNYLARVVEHAFESWTAEPPRAGK